MSAAVGLGIDVGGTNTASVLIGYGPDDFPSALREDIALIRGGHEVMITLHRQAKVKK